MILPVIRAPLGRVLPAIAAYVIICAFVRKGLTQAFSAAVEYT